MTFNVYDIVWYMQNNALRQKIIFAVIDSMNDNKDGVERIYRLVIGAGWGNNSGIVVEESKIFKTKEDLLKSL